DRGRLAGPVLAQQAEDLAGLDVEIEVVDGDEVAVMLREPARPDRPGRRGLLRHLLDRLGTDRSDGPRPLDRSRPETGPGSEAWAGRVTLPSRTGSPGSS